MLVDDSLCQNPTGQPRYKTFNDDAYADHTILQTEKNRIDRVSNTWIAEHRINAAELGVEVFDIPTPQHVKGGWE